MQEILIVPQGDDGVDDAITDHERMNAGLVLTDRSFAALAIVKLDALLMEQSIVNGLDDAILDRGRSEEHTSELPSLMRTSSAVFCLKQKLHYLTKMTPDTISQDKYKHHNMDILN